MSTGFLAWRPGTAKDRICKLKSLSGAEDSFEIDEGISRLNGWPEDVHAKMDPRFPKDTGLADSLPGASFIVVSQKTRQFLEDEKVPRIEFLPMKILDLKGGVASADYFVVNPLTIVDCIDPDASGVEMDSLDKGAFCGCEQLILREVAIPADVPVFRFEHWRQVIGIRRELADRMKAAGLTGLRFIEPLKYTGLV